MKEYQEKIAEIPQESIAYVDESGIDTYKLRNLYRPTGMIKPVVPQGTAENFV